MLVGTTCRRGEREGGAPRIAVQAWSEALRDPALRERVGQTFTILGDGLTQLVQRARDEGRVADDVDPEVAGRVLLSLIPGFVLRRLIQDESLTSADLVADLRPMLTGLRQG